MGGFKTVLLVVLATAVMSFAWTWGMNKLGMGNHHQPQLQLTVPCEMVRTNC